MGHTMVVHLCNEETDFSSSQRSQDRDPLFSGHLPGTLQSSKISSQVLEPLIPSLSSFLEVLKPGIPFAGNQRRSWLDLAQGGLKRGKLTSPTDSDTCPACPHLLPSSPSAKLQPSRLTDFIPNSSAASLLLPSSQRSSSSSTEFSPQPSSLSQGHDSEDNLRAHTNSSAPLLFSQLSLKEPRFQPPARLDQEDADARVLPNAQGSDGTRCSVTSGPFRFQS